MWTVETLNKSVDNEIKKLPSDCRARLVKIAQLIENVGLDSLPTAIVKHLEGKLWEIRVKAASGVARAIYVTATGQRVIIVRAFIKKTQKTPQRELEIARTRVREIT